MELGGHKYKGVRVRFTDFISFILNIPCETKLFHFHWIFNSGGANPPLDPPL